MLYITPNANATKALTSSEKEEARLDMKAVSLEYMIEMLEELYEAANQSGHRTFIIASGTDQDGNDYSDMQVVLCGAFTRDNTRWAICQGGIFLNFDQMVESLKESYALVV